MTSTATKPTSPIAGPSATQASVIVVLAGGMLLQALNIYLTSALMPSIVTDIGGQAYYAWVTTTFIVASVAATMAVPTVLGRLGSRTAYLLSGCVFGIGSAIAAAAPTMALILVGRVVQGIGGGLLSGLAFALIRSSLPERAWGKGTAIISAMFGLGTLAGPTIGGAFAQFGAWRTAFGLIAITATALGVAAVKILPPSSRSKSPGRLPWLSLLVLTGAVGSLSMAGVVPSGWIWIALVTGAALISVFVAMDRRSKSGVLPSITYRAGTLKWLYISLALTTTVTASEAFTPLFGQRVFVLAPFAAGFLGATVSAGWSIAALASARVASSRVQRWVALAGPVITVAAMLGLIFLQFVAATPWALGGWVVALIFAGAGTGLSNPHLSVWVMSSVQSEAQGAKAAAAIPVASLIGQAIVAALGGTVVNAGLPSYAHAGCNLFILIGVVTLLGAFAVGVSIRHQPQLGSHHD